MKRTRNLFAWLLAIGLRDGASSSSGQLLFQRSGSTNPTNEGFALLSYGSPTLEPVNDAGTSAWAIRMLHTDAGASSTYNTYALKYDADTDSADLWINGTEVYSDIVAPHWSAAPVFGWSGYQHPNDMQVNWSLVSLEIVPEPATFTIVLLGGFIMLGRHRGQRGRP